MLLRPIFAQKMNPPLKEFGCRSCEVVAVIRPEKPFEFPILAKKTVSISMKTFFFYAFGDHLLLGSKTMKIRVKVAHSCLTLSKKPPLFQILATRLVPYIEKDK